MTANTATGAGAALAPSRAMAPTSRATAPTSRAMAAAAAATGAVLLVGRAPGRRRATAAAPESSMHRRQ